MSNCNGPTYCEVCGDLGDRISAEGWCTCAIHVATPERDRKRYWWRTGEELNERGIAPSEVRPTPRSRYDHHRPFCELCGAHPGASVSIEGWSTCDEHFRAPKPDRAIFDWRTGVRLGPYDDPAVRSGEPLETHGDAADDAAR